MSKSTYELYQDSQDLIIEGCNGETEPEDWLAAVQTWAGDCDDKLLALRVVRRGMLERDGAAQGQAERFNALSQRAKAAVRRIEGLAATLIVAREQLTGGEGARVATSDGGWVKMQSYPKVDDSRADLDVLAKDHPELVDIVTTTTRRLDKKTAKRWLKSGARIPGLVLDDNRKIKWSK